MLIFILKSLTRAVITEAAGGSGYGEKLIENVRITKQNQNWEKIKALPSPIYKYKLIFTRRGNHCIRGGWGRIIDFIKSYMHTCTDKVQNTTLQAHDYTAICTLC